MRVRSGAPVVAVGLFYAMPFCTALAFLIWMTPQPDPVPIPPVYTDTTHQAIDGHDHEYTIDMPYAEMNDTQRGDANRFARRYPYGKKE